MSSRPLAALVPVILSALGLLVLLPDCASACSCALVGSKEERVERAISGSGAVFSGEVVDFENAPNITMMEGEMVTMMGGNAATATVTLRVSEVWKGPRQQTVQIATAPNDGISCGYPFEEGQEYLVYTHGGQRGPTVDLCSETKPLSKAGVDLALLGNSEKPKDGDGALTDTSGGVSVRAMAGMAGLAVAASLLLVVRLVRSG